MSDVSTTPLLSVRGLVKHFPVKKGVLQRTVGQVHAVDDISFDIAEGETLGLVGESGCGKSTAGKAILKLIEPTAGEIRVNGERIDGLSRHEMRPYRRELQVVFQDPYSSLNPRLRIRDIIVEHISRRIAVMYLGKIVELADRASLFSRPQHPYTEALLSAVPVPDPEAEKKRIILRGDVPSPINPPSGCRFHTRCPYAFDRCSKEEPPMQEVLPGQFVACHLRDAGPAPLTAVVPGATGSKMPS